MTGALPILGVAALLVGLVMAVVFRVAVRLGNAGVVDVAWAGNFTLLALLYAALGGGWLPRRLLVATLVAVWSVRLSAYLALRVMGDHPVEDGRYRQLRREWAPHADRRFFWFFEAQAALNLILSVPVLLACLDPRPRFHPWEMVATTLFGMALLGEAVADRQLDRFRRDPAHRGRTCDLGLWRYSRHPNYFFEWLVWVACWLFALPSPGGPLTVYCPLLMLYFLLRVTGIPRTEAQAAQTRSDYREYQRTTSMFVPWFRRARRGQ